MSKKHTIKAFERHFTDVLDVMSRGETIYHAMAVHNVDESFLSWVLSDPERKVAYERAQEMACEALAYKMMELQNAPAEEQYLAKTKMDIYKFLISKWNHERYGEKKSVEQKVTVDINKAIEQADARLIQGRVIDADE